MKPDHHYETLAHHNGMRLTVLRAIADLIAQDEFSPTVREIGTTTGLSSSATVQSHLERLRIDGLVSWRSGCQRTLKVTEKGREALAQIVRGE